MITLLKSVFPSQPAYRGRIPESADCYRCGSKMLVHRHHIFAGSMRDLSEREGLWVYLCRECNQGNNGIHAKKTIKGYEYTDDEHLRWHAQSQWELNHMKNGITQSEARELWKMLLKSGTPSYEYVAGDRHGQWLQDWGRCGR